jgi:hypothetical protein
MKISEIKDKELRELAELKRVVGNREDRLAAAFAWDYTPEGSVFWGAVYNGTRTTITNEDSIVNQVIEKMKSRSEVGIKKYGTTLDRKDLTHEQWLDHAIEEAMDLTLYLTKIKNETQF